jgi:hypothetical protein
MENMFLLRKLVECDDDHWEEEERQHVQIPMAGYLGLSYLLFCAVIEKNDGVSNKSMEY